MMQATSILWITREFWSSVVWFKIPLAFQVAFKSSLLGGEDDINGVEEA